MWYVPTLVHGVAREAAAHDVVNVAVVDPSYGEHGHVSRILPVCLWDTDALESLYYAA